INNNILDFVNNQQKISIITFLDKIIEINKLEREILFLTLHNARRIECNEILLKISNDNLFVIFIILFWLANKIISLNIIPFEIIKCQIEQFKYNHKNIEELHNYICEALKWI